jgi:hypothetical protein
MTDRAAQFHGNLFSSLGLMVGDVLGISVPVTLVIIWICA